MHINDITGMYLTYSSDGAFIMIDKISKSFDVEYVWLRKQMASILLFEFISLIIYMKLEIGYRKIARIVFVVMDI